MARYVVLAATVFLSAVSSATLAKAQQDVLGEIYGRGVHAYFAGDYEKAHELLTEAIEQGSKDPRCYLYRGLAYYMSGRPDEAEDDFKAGAELEATATDRVYDVSRSLQRIQGDIRLKIEEHRQDARLAAREIAAKRARARYQEFQRSQEDATLQPTERLTIPPRTDVPAESPTVNDPFNEGDAAPAETPNTVETPEADPAVGPESEGTIPEETPDEGAAPQDDPFGELQSGDAAAAGTRAEAAAGASARATTTQTTEDPFGELETTEETPDQDTEDTAVEPNDTDPATEDDPAANDTTGAGAAGASGGKRRGALGGLFRAFQGSIPQPPRMPGAGNMANPLAPPSAIEPQMEEEEESPDPFGDLPQSDEAIPDTESTEEVPSSDEVPTEDPFGPQ